MYHYVQTTYFRINNIVVVETLLFSLQGDIAKFYTAAVVEYATPYTPALSADEVMIRNAANYVEYMTNASLNQVKTYVYRSIYVAYISKLQLITRLYYY